MAYALLEEAKFSEALEKVEKALEILGKLSLLLEGNFL
jgi:hypothetical protein